MFTGIVKGLYKVTTIDKKEGLTRYAVNLNDFKNVQVGASISIDGVCQTVVHAENNNVWFEAIEETLNLTTLDTLHIGRLVNVEPSAKIGDEIGGHLLSGHIIGKAKITQVIQKPNNHIVHLSCPLNLIKYCFPKGFIALDGASLTLVDVEPKGHFTVHLIPETLKRTTFGFKRENAFVNLEIDAHIQAIVTTIEERLEGLRPSTLPKGEGRCPSTLPKG